MFQIFYSLRGPFGGEGGYVQQRPDLRAYEIMTSKDGKAATKIQILIYAPGCKIQRISRALLNSAAVSENFVCNGLPNVTLAGQIKPDEMRRAGNSELEVDYMAYWAHEFFGIMDGPVFEIRLGPVSLDDDGMFRVDLPDFDLESPESAAFKPSASFRLRLRDAKTGNPIIDNLIPEPPEFRSADGHLSIRSAYPLGMQFTSGPHKR